MSPFPLLAGFPFLQKHDAPSAGIHAGANAESAPRSVVAYILPRCRRSIFVRIALCIGARPAVPLNSRAAPYIPLCPLNKGKSKIVIQLNFLTVRNLNCRNMNFIQGGEELSISDILLQRLRYQSTNLRILIRMFREDD